MERLQAMSSPPLPPQSDDELFRPQNSRLEHHETVDTLPIYRTRDSPELDTLATLPPIPNGQDTQRRGLASQWHNTDRNQNTTNGTYQTQPTQIIENPASDVSSPPPQSVIQVSASSPMVKPPPPMRRPNGILASAMAPAGTAFRRPYVASAISRRNDPISLVSDEEDAAESSDSDRAERARHDIKTSTFKRNTDKVLESPQGGSGLSRFQKITQGSLYNSSDYGSGSKRSSDTMANAYGGVTKKPRQSGPSRAVPVGAAVQPAEVTDMDLDDIFDFNARSKVRRMRAIYPNHRVRDMFEALQAKKGNFDDAVDYLMSLSENKAKSISNMVDLVGSEDELRMSPIANKKFTSASVAPHQDTRQQAKKPTKTINEKWSNTQGVTKKAAPQSRRLDVFDDPGPAPVKPRKLMRGRRNPSPENQEPAAKSKQEQKKVVITLSDESDDAADSGMNSEAEDGDFEDRLLKFFNTCTAADLADTASISRDLAEVFVSKRPFKSMDTVTKVENPNLKTTKSKRKTAPIGEKIADKVDEMLRSYEAVDYLVKKCDTIAKPLAAEMKSWGVDVHGSGLSGELDMTNLTASDRSSGASLDSGLGTPISDDDRDSIRGSTTRKLLGQPASMAEGIKMKDYQIVGLNWLNLLFRKKYSCILADDMGLGKTLQTIAFLAHLAESGVKGPSLIVVPAATLENWLKEFARFCPGLAVEPYYAPYPAERLEMRETIDDMRDDINVIITTYTIAKAKDDFPWLRSFGFCCTIFDEGHVLKNADSKVSRNLMRITSQWRLLLTGTPLQNNLKELISLLSFLMPDIFKQKQEDLEVIFKQDVKTINDDAESQKLLLSKERIVRARSMLTPFILRRKKWQVLKDLPKKDRQVKHCVMNSAQEAIYNGWLARAFDVRERRANGERIPTDESANILMKLRQAAIHPLLFRHRYQDSDLKKIAKACLKDPQWEASNPDLIFVELVEYSDFEIHQLCAKSKALQKFSLQHGEISESGKVQAMIQLLQQFMSEGHRTLIFSQFVMVLDILEVVLSEHNIRFFRLDGNTKVSERQDLIDEFNEEIDENDPDAATKRQEQVPVFMLSTKAGGAGINLASASRVIIFDSGFNPQDDVQAENRAHRIGQKKEVEVWRLVTQGTVEEQIYGMGMVKLRLDREVAGEGAEDGEERGSKPDKAEGDEKENEGRRVVEEMFFKKLDETPQKLKKSDEPPKRLDTDPNMAEEVIQAGTMVTRAGDASTTSASAPSQSSELKTSSTSQSQAESETKLTTKAQIEDAKDQEETETKPEEAEHTTTQANGLSDSEHTKATKKLPARSKRPKAGSRKGSSQSASQSASQRSGSQSKSRQTKLSFGRD